MNKTFNNPQGRASVAGVFIILLVVANAVFDVIGLMLDMTKESNLEMYGTAGILLLVGTIGAAVGFLRWFVRAAKNIRVIHPNARFEYTPGWCAGWFFIPFANLVKPFRAMREVWLHSDAEVQYSPPPILQLWWGCYIGSGIVGNVAGRIENVETSSFVGMISTALSAVAAVCILNIMKNVSERQNLAFATRERDSRLQETLRHAADATSGT